MTRKIVWLFLWTTLAFWAGCAMDRDTQQGELAVRPSAAQAPEPFPEDPQPSVVGVSRENWQRNVYSVPRGRVAHHPHYFTCDFYGESWYLGQDRRSPLQRSGDVTTEAYAVTGGARREMGVANLFDTLVGVEKAALDLMLLPVNAVFVARPWDVVYSPPQ